MRNHMGAHGGSHACKIQGIDCLPPVVRLQNMLDAALMRQHLAARCDRIVTIHFIVKLPLS